MGTVTVLQAPKAYDDLPPRKKEFIKQYVRTGDARKAYLAAGYKESHVSGKKARDLRLELARHIAEAVQEYARSSDMAILGLNTLERIAKESSSDQARLNAAKELLERALPEGPKEVNINHSVRNLSDDQIDAKLAKLANELRGDSAIDVTPEKT